MTFSALGYIMIQWQQLTCLMTKPPKLWPTNMILERDDPYKYLLDVLRLWNGRFFVT